MVLMLSTSQLLVWTCFACAIVLLSYVSVASTRLQNQGRFFTSEQVAVSMIHTYRNVFLPILGALMFFSFVYMFTRPPISIPNIEVPKVERSKFESQSLTLAPKPILWPTAIHTAKINNRQIECLALNMYHESRGELDNSILLYGRKLNQAQLVAEVTLRRAHSMGKSLCDVVYQDQQFSWTLGSVDVKDHFVYQSLYRAAEKRLQTYRQGRQSPLPINHFYSHRILKNPPDWASGMKVVAVVGSHTYLYSTSAKANI